MKYKIVKCGHPNGREGSGIIGGDIIELEPLDCPEEKKYSFISGGEMVDKDGKGLDCPASECDFCGTINNAHHSAECVNRRDKPKESLVSIDDVIKVFDGAIEECNKSHIARSTPMYATIRNAIKQMKRSE